MGEITFELTNNSAKIFLDNSLLSYTSFKKEEEGSRFFKHDNLSETTGLALMAFGSNIQGKGYGTELLNRIIQHFQNINEVEYLTLGVFKDNPGAIHLYEKVGFKKFFENENSFYMIYPLSAELKKKF